MKRRSRLNSTQAGGAHKPRSILGRVGLLSLGLLGVTWFVLTFGDGEQVHADPMTAVHPAESRSDSATSARTGSSLVDPRGTVAEPLRKSATRSLDASLTILDSERFEPIREGVWSFVRPDAPASGTHHFEVDETANIPVEAGRWIISAPDRWTLESDTVVVAEGEHRTVLASRAGSFRVRVVDAAGQPVVSASVVVLIDSESMWMTWLRRQAIWNARRAPRSALTNDAGVAVLPIEGARSVRLAAVHPSFGVVSKRSFLRAGSEEEIVLPTLGEPTRLTVIDAASSEPLSGVLLVTASGIVSTPSDRSGTLLYWKSAVNGSFVAATRFDLVPLSFPKSKLESLEEIALAEVATIRWVSGNDLDDHDPGLAVGPVSLSLIGEATAPALELLPSWQSSGRARSGEFLVPAGAALRLDAVAAGVSLHAETQVARDGQVLELRPRPLQAPLEIVADPDDRVRVRYSDARWLAIPLDETGFGRAPDTHDVQRLSVTRGSARYELTKLAESYRAVIRFPRSHSRSIVVKTAEGTAHRGVRLIFSNINDYPALSDLAPEGWELRRFDMESATSLRTSDGSVLSELPAGRYDFRVFKVGSAPLSDGSGAAEVPLAGGVLVLPDQASSHTIQLEALNSRSISIRAATPAGDLVPTFSIEWRDPLGTIRRQARDGYWSGTVSTLVDEMIVWGESGTAAFIHLEPERTDYQVVLGGLEGLLVIQLVGLPESAAQLQVELFRALGEQGTLELASEFKLARHSTGEFFVDASSIDPNAVVRLSARDEAGVTFRSEFVSGGLLGFGAIVMKPM